MSYSTRLRRHPSFNPSGDKFTFFVFGSNADLYVLNTDGTSLNRLTYDQAVDLVNTWSPDGNMIVFSTSRTTGYGSNRSIWKLTFQAPAQPTLQGPASSNDGEIKLYGTTSPGAEVRINHSIDGEIAQTTADSKGDYHATVSLAEGTHTLAAYMGDYQQSLGTIYSNYQSNSSRDWCSRGN